MIPYNPIDYYDLGFIQIEPEPIAMILAFIVFIFLVYIGFKKEKIKFDIKEGFIFFLVVIFSALAGGRLWYYIANWEGWQTLIDLFDIRQQGLVSLGMIVGGAIGLLFYSLLKAKKEKKKIIWQIEFARFADILVAPAALGIFIYRLFGCTVYGDVVGTPTNVPWCFMWPDGICRHPAPVYEALAALLIFILLKVFFGREKR